MFKACRKLCKVDSDFSSLPLSSFKLKNRHWWNSGPKYHRINYVVKVNLGPADVSFELWHNGVKLSKENSIKVEWQAAAPPESIDEMAMDFPMSSLPAAQRQRLQSSRNDLNQNSLLYTQPVNSSLHNKGSRNAKSGGRWDHNTGMWVM